MRILLVGGDGPLLRILASRFSQADQAVALLTGPAPGLEIPICAGEPQDLAASRAAIAGCQALVWLALEGSEAPSLAAARSLSAAIVAERIARAVAVTRAPPLTPGDWWARVVAAEDALLEGAGPRCHAVALRPGLLLAPGSPPQIPAVGGDPDRAVALADARDVAGAVEGALWKGEAGARYAVAGGASTLARLRTFGRVGGEAARLPAPVDCAAAASALGWWARSLERSLTEAGSVTRQPGS